MPLNTKHRRREIPTISGGGGGGGGGDEWQLLEREKCFI